MNCSRIHLNVVQRVQCGVLTLLPPRSGGDGSPVRSLPAALLPRLSGDALYHLALIRVALPAVCRYPDGCAVRTGDGWRTDPTSRLGGWSRGRVLARGGRIGRLGALHRPAPRVDSLTTDWFAGCGASRPVTAWLCERPALTIG